MTNPPISDAPQPAEEAAAENAKNTKIALGLGGFALVLGVIALVLALNAKSVAEDDTADTAAVQQQEDAAIAAAKVTLQDGIDQAEQTVADLEKADAAAKETRKELKADTATNSENIAANTEDIASLQRQVDALKADNQDLSKQIDDLEQAAETTP